MSDHPYDRLTPDAVIDAVESTGRLIRCALTRPQQL